jgi:hypothetical protein
MEVGKKNISFGWIWILAGFLVGAVMGMWSFNGPLASPFGDYTSLPRRLLRLSHIAFIALAIINILYGYEIDKVKLKEKTKQIGSLCMIYGTVLMSVFLLAAAFFEPFKYFTMISTVLVIVAVAIILAGQLKKKPFLKIFR